MAGRLKVIDLMSGMGGRSLGFQRAGYDVIYAVDNSRVCEEVYSQEVGSNQFVLSDIEDIAIENFPEADVITAKLIMYSFRTAGSPMKAKHNGNEMVFKIISHKRPKAFVLEIPSAMIAGNRSKEFRALLEMEVFRNYFITYRIVSESAFSGFPVIGNQAYVVGIRTDMYHDELYFPQGEYGERSIYQEDADKVGEWYRKIRFNVDLELNKNKFYVKNGKEFSETEFIHMGLYRENYILDTIGLRKLTHNECAFLKGLEKYDFNRCSNKRDMYIRIAYASNVYVMRAIAESLRSYLEKNIYIAEDRVIPLKIEEKREKKGLQSQKVQQKGILPQQKLTKLHIDYLKGLKNLDIAFDKNLTAIMGVNGSGKSTIIHALACVYKTYECKDYKFSFFFTPNPDSNWKNSKFSISYWDEISQKEYTREYRKDTDRWAPHYANRPQRDTYFIGIETCVPEIESERQTSYIDYKTSIANERNIDKIIQSASYILNKNYDHLNYHKTKKKELLGVHTKDNMNYSALSMGAGEQRVLKILRIIYTANQYSLILIDEIDLLLHVTALKRLIVILSQVAQKRNLQIIFTTHSMEMSRLQEYVDIRYLHPLEEKTMVYDMITPDIVYEMSEDIEQPIKIFVEDILAEIIVNELAVDLGMLRNIKVIKLGAASNIFVTAASLILQEEDVTNVLIMLDGDVYRSKDDKRNAVKKVLSGTEKDHDHKVDKALSLIHQFILPEKTEPEKFIYDMLAGLKDNNEITSLARQEKAVSDSHQWLDHLVTRMGKSEEFVLSKIVSMVSDHEKWAIYVKELREWLIAHK